MRGKMNKLQERLTFGLIVFIVMFIIGGNQELWEMKNKVDGRIALIGGMGQYNVLTAGTVEDIQGQMQVLFDKVGGDGGYILSSADHFFHTPPRNLKAYADAVRQCVY